MGHKCNFVAPPGASVPRCVTCGARIGEAQAGAVEEQAEVGGGEDTPKPKKRKKKASPQSSDQ